MPVQAVSLHQTYRGSIAAEAAMAAEQAAVRCTLERLRCPRTVLCNTRLHVGCSPGHVRLGGGAAHARQMVACLMPRRRRERPHHAPGSWNPGSPPASLPFLWSPANSTGSPTSLPYPAATGPYRTAFGAFADRRPPAPADGLPPSRPCLAGFLLQAPVVCLPWRVIHQAPDGRFCKGPLAVHMADGMTRRPVALAPDA